MQVAHVNDKPLQTGEGSQMDDSVQGTQGSQAGSSVKHKKKNGFFTRFARQEFRGWSPIITARAVVLFYFLAGLVFIPLGVAILVASLNVREYRARYDNTGAFSVSTDPQAQQALLFSGGDAGIPSQVSVNVTKEMKAPVYVYYELDNYYQNYRRYVRSLDNKQLAGKNSSGSACQPELYFGGANQRNGSLPNNGVINPCGLIAWSNFNDSFTASYPNGSAVALDDSAIAWSYDSKHLYGHYKAINYNTDPNLRGGNTTEDYINDSQHFMVWMRVASHPSFRKLYAEIHTDIPAGTSLTFNVTNRYNTYNYKGKKWLVVSTTSWVGGKDTFLGILYLTLGGLAELVALGFFAASFLGKRRKFGDLDALSWNRKQE